MALAALLFFSLPPAAAPGSASPASSTIYSTAATQNAPASQGRSSAAVQADAADPAESHRAARPLEDALRQLSRTIEQLQYRNQRLERQVRAMQQGGAGAATAAPPPAATTPLSRRAPRRRGQDRCARLKPGRRSDVFDPSQQPPRRPARRARFSAACRRMAPRIAAARRRPTISRSARARWTHDAARPLDLSTLSSNPPPPVGHGFPAPLAAAAAPMFAMASVPGAIQHRLRPVRNAVAQSLRRD